MYAVFGTKRAILAELLAARTVGDDDAGPAAGPRRVAGHGAEPDPRRQIACWPRIATRIGYRIAGLYEVMAAARRLGPGDRGD